MLLALTAELFDRVPLDRMPDAEEALRAAAADIPVKAYDRFDTAEKLSDEDRETIIEIAGQSLAFAHKITGAWDLQSVVRTMNAVATSSIGQYDNSVVASADYYRTAALGLGACLRESGPAALGCRLTSITLARYLRRTKVLKYGQWLNITLPIWQLMAAL